MAFRNVLVKPLGLATSPLGCPVSSLLYGAAGGLFRLALPGAGAARHARDCVAEVILGADDKHLRFRSASGCRARGRQRWT
jgi:hypothetical protein